jgi:hypothetical protein
MIKKTKSKEPVIDMGFDLTAKTPDLKKKKKKKKVEPTTALAVLDDEDLDLVVTKKKKVAEPVDPDAPQRISRLDGTLQSILGDDAEALQQLLESGDSDSAMTALNRKMLQTSIDLIAEVENGVRASKGRYGVIAFNNLIMSIRELMTDMQATKDRGAMGMTLAETMLRPLLLDIAMMLMTEYSGIMSSAKSCMSNDDYKEFRRGVEESRTRAGSFMQDQYQKAKDQVIEFMQR